MSRSPLACGDRSGFLFAHACDRPAAGACAICSRPICIEHTRMGSSGPTCITCLRDDGSTDRSSSDHGSTGSGHSSDAGGHRGAGGDIATEGQYGGAGASADWAGRPEATAKADDPYFFDGGPERATYYDADDYAAFDAVASAAAQDAARDSAETGGAPDTDTGAS
jgi:hypothetical protein